MRPLTCCASVFVLLAASAFAGAETKFDAAARAKAIAPFVEEETVALVHIDLSRVALQPTFAFLSQVLPNAPSDVRSGAAAKMLNEVLHAGVKDIYLVVTPGGQNGPLRMYEVYCVPSGADVKALRAILQIPADVGQMIAGALVLPSPRGNPQTDRQLAEFRPVKRPELTATFEAAGDTAVQVVLIPPAYAHRVIEELAPQLPKELGGGPSTALTRGMSWAAAGIDFPPRLSLRLVVQAVDAQAAEALRAKLVDLMRLAGQRKEVLAVVPKFDEVATLLTPKVEDNRLVLVLDEKNQGVEKCLSALIPPVELIQAKHARYQSMNDLKMIGLAMHNYYYPNKHFPLPASRSPDGKPLLSWRVHILPYLDQMALFQQFHLDESWDSPHNRTLIDKMPAVYRLSISKTEPGRTNYLLPVGNGALFDADKPTEFKDIKDGTSNTIMVVTVDDQHAVIWTKPDDWAFDPKDPAKGLGRFFDGGFNATFCDGSARWFAWPQDPKDVARLRALFTRAGGEVIEW